MMEQLKQYGKIGIVTHLGISWTFLGVMYMVVRRSKQSDKIIKYLKLEDKIPKQAGAFAVAAIIYKAVMPARIAFSLMAIPLMIKFLGIKVTPIQTVSEQQPKIIDISEKQTLSQSALKAQLKDLISQEQYQKIFQTGKKVPEQLSIK